MPSLLLVWQALGGPEPRGRRGRAWWRGGEHLSVTLDPERGIWHDHVSGFGGGVVRLVETARACSRLEALDWLRLTFGWPDTDWTREQRRDYGRRRACAEGLAERALLWRTALLRQCEQAKTAAYEQYIEYPNPQTEMAWSDAAKHSYFVGQLSGATLARVYRTALERNPAAVEQLIAESQEEMADSKRFAALVVATLAMEAVSDGQ